MLVCGKHEQQVERLIDGPSEHICNECIELCDELISEGPY